MAKISVTCPKCLNPGSVDEALLGKKGRCKKCGTTIILARAVPGSQGQLPYASGGSEAASGASDPASAASRPTAEDNVPVVWKPGDLILDLYEVTGVLGEGGMGKVYKAHHRGWNVDLAVKSPRPEILSTAGAAENFEREAETWIRLGLHPHTVSCYYVRRLGGIPRVFAEFVEGGSLKDWIDSGKLYEGGHDATLVRMLDIAIQFAWGLHHAHERSLVHQDVKPANVMLTPEGIAKVTDFGLAKARAMGGESSQVRPGQSILVSSGGMTPAYCSPEQAARQPLSRKTDLWSWAVSVLEMFTGEVTWSSGVVAAQALEGYLSSGSGDPRIPPMAPGLAALLRRCFQKDVGSRPTGLAALLRWGSPKDVDARPADFGEVAGVLAEVYRQATGTSYPREPPQGAERTADALNNWALSLRDLGKDSEAERLWGEALRLDPHHLETVHNWGLARWRSGRMTDEGLLRELREAGTTYFP